MNKTNESSLESKRSTGEFFTKDSLAQYVGLKILSFIKPNLIIEPYAGEGSLLQPFLSNNIKCILNDIDDNNFQKLLNNFTSNNVKIYNQDIISIDIQKFLSDLSLDKKNEPLLIYTNPPFGTSSTNSLASKKSENIDKKSRNIAIKYSNLEKYGKGDLILPAIGKLIEIIKSLNYGYLAFYSPLGIFCKRKRYQKLLEALLGDFTFMWGEIFPGDQFQGVSKSKPIAISLWKFEKSVKTKISSLTFQYADKIIPLKPVPLLKDFWKYDTRKRITGEIAVQGNDRFNVMAPKMFHLKVEKGGSEVIKENLIQELNISYIPDELALALWSIVVGYRSLTSYPIYVDNAYVHVPDFSKDEVQKILVYTILAVIISEELNHYTNGKIGFNKKTGQLQFGNDRLTKAVQSFLEVNNTITIGEFTISEILFQIKNHNLLRDKSKEWRKNIKDSIEILLEKISYWDFIPVPRPT